MRVIVIGEDPLARAGLAGLLEEGTDLEVIAQVAASDSVIAAHRAHQPDAVIWDLGWGSDSLDWRDSLTELIEAGGRVVALLAESSQSIEAWAAGARGLLGREASPERVLAAVYAVEAGLTAVDPQFDRRLRPPAESLDEPTPEELTQRERQVLMLMAEGLANKTIANRLEISEHTVKFHVNAILRKLGAQSRTEAVMRATRLGLILL